MTNLASPLSIPRRRACLAAVLGCVLGASALCGAAADAPAAGVQLPDTIPPSPDVRSLLVAINQYRRQHGLAALEPAPALELLALEHSREMATLRLASHAGFTARFQRAGSDLCVENVAFGFATAEAAVQGWRASPLHDRNLLEPRLRRVGIASVDRYVTMFACETAGVPAPASQGRVALRR